MSDAGLDAARADRTEDVEALAAVQGELAASPRRGLCLGCNYRLDGLAERRCPECGRAFDPGDRRTMNMGRPMGAVARAVCGPTGWPAFAVVATVCLCATYLATDPAAYYMIANVCLAAMLVGAVGGALVLWALVRNLVVDWYRQPQPAGDFDSRWGRATLVLLVVVPVLIVCRVPLYVGFFVSRYELDRMADRYAGDPTVVLGYGAGARRVSERAGVYYVTSVNRLADGGVMLHVNGYGSGFALYPHNRNLAGQYNSGAEGRLPGGWWWFADD